MCVSVAFTAGCSFATVEEANKAAATVQSRAEPESDCVSIFCTCACTFADIKDAAAAAQLHLAGASQANAKCVSAAFSAVCTI